jgi:hypothetical protein
MNTISVYSSAGNYSKKPIRVRRRIGGCYGGCGVIASVKSEVDNPFPPS